MHRPLHAFRLCLLLVDTSHQLPTSLHLLLSGKASSGVCPCVTATTSFCPVVSLLIAGRNTSIEAHARATLLLVFVSLAGAAQLRHLPARSESRRKANTSFLCVLRFPIRKPPSPLLEITRLKISRSRKIVPIGSVWKPVFCKASECCAQQVVLFKPALYLSECLYNAFQKTSYFATIPKPPLQHRPHVSQQSLARQQVQLWQPQPARDALHLAPQACCGPSVNATTEPLLRRQQQRHGPLGRSRSSCHLPGGGSH